MDRTVYFGIGFGFCMDEGTEVDIAVVDRELGERQDVGNVGYILASKASEARTRGAVGGARIGFPGILYTDDGEGELFQNGDDALTGVFCGKYLTEGNVDEDQNNDDDEEEDEEELSAKPEINTEASPSPSSVAKSASTDYPVYGKFNAAADKGPVSTSDKTQADYKAASKGDRALPLDPVYSYPPKAPYKASKKAALDA